MSTLEKVLYGAGIGVACVAGLAPERLWTFSVCGLPGSLFSLLIGVALAALFMVRGEAVLEPASDSVESTKQRWGRRAITFTIADPWASISTSAA